MISLRATASFTVEFLSAREGAEERRGLVATSSFRAGLATLQNTIWL